MNQIFSGKLIFPFSVAAVVLVTGGVFAWSQMNQPSAEPGPQPTSNSNGQKQIDAGIEAKLQELGLTRDGVKLYRNEELGFAFLYPVINADNNVEIIDTKGTLGGGSRRELEFSLSFCNLIDCTLSVDLFGEKSPVSTVGQLENHEYDYPFIDEKKVELKKERSDVNGLEALETNFWITDENGVNRLGSFTQFIHDNTLYTFYSFDENSLYKDVFQISFVFLE